jgi:hypothetical protein
MAASTIRNWWAGRRREPDSVRTRTRRQRRTRAWAGVSRVPLNPPGNREEFPSMNRPRPMCYAPKSAWTSGRCGESPIGACGDDFKHRKLQREQRLMTRQSGLGTFHAAGDQGTDADPTDRDACFRSDRPRRPEMFNNRTSRRPRRWCLDFSLLIGGTRFWTPVIGG